MAATLLLLVWKPVVALEANRWLLGEDARRAAQGREQAGLNNTLAPSLPMNLASYDMEGDQKLLQDWARYKGLQQSADLRILTEELMVRRRYLLPDGHEVEVVSTVPASDPQPANNIY